ncbi:MAG: methyltransferase domain-containing protein [Nitrospirae bacterium]|nr:methyltransferase domain-containing protein [Nitrospirota bacterium]
MEEYRALHLDEKKWCGLPEKDDFNWNLYNLHYRGEMSAISKEHTMQLKKEDFLFLDGKLKQANKSILPLHPNWQLLYETVLQLNPESVFEMGCGNGMHLNNFQTLSPNIKLFGIDRSQEQLKYLRECHPYLKAEIILSDATIPIKWKFPKVDIAYTQAVIMHIQTGDSHLTALTNLFNISRNQVVLVENWNKHEFMSDIKGLFERKSIDWSNLYIYYRISEHFPETRLLICSSMSLDYPPLTDYKQLIMGD